MLDWQRALRQVCMHAAFGSRLYYFFFLSFLPPLEAPPLPPSPTDSCDPAPPSNPLSMSIIFCMCAKSSSSSPSSTLRDFAKRSATSSWWTFSKVSSTVILYTQDARALTFENFYHALCPVRSLVVPSICHPHLTAHGTIVQDSLIHNVDLLIVKPHTQTLNRKP